MTSRVGTKGQVVIPKAMRDELGLVPGAEVRFEVDETGVRVLPATRRDVLLDLRGKFKGAGLVEGLMEDRAREPR